MATVSRSVSQGAQVPDEPDPPVPESPVVLNRVRTVRQQQGVSLRSAARHLGTDIRQTRSLEHESTDMRLSDLYRWQKALDVPVSELLVEAESPLSRPVMERARLVRLMKTTMAIRERSSSSAIQRMADTMIEQLVEIMPELREVSSWHTIGQRRSLEDYGRVVERQVPDDVLRHPTVRSDT